MNSHELAKMLLDNPPVEVGASLDISVDDDNAGNRVLGSGLVDAFVHAGEVTLFFDSACYNDANPVPQPQGKTGEVPELHNPQTTFHDNYMRQWWHSHGGKAHGPNVEHWYMTEEEAIPFMRQLVMCQIALQQLVALKSYKDEFGKTENYKIQQPLAWAEARRTLALPTEPEQEQGLPS